MTREQWKGSLILSVVLGVIGLILLFGSANFGPALANNWLANQSDWTETTDTAVYLLVAQAHINNFYTVGLIFTVVGLAAAMLTYYKFLTGEKQE